ncbi:GTP-binding protein [Actinophytocola sp. NPDC049390]|uniref:GTP-binding protein n=1 Tax=Actinophytocola sp. NPDC049390 TaxID=3363894 RepID=UPI00378839E7
MAIFVPVSGFLGAGKTTTLLAAARELRARGHRPAIVTNDQGCDLVDTRLARTLTDAVGEVLDGCFCCRFGDLAEVTTTLVEAGADVVLAEAVGSCTDLRATVVRPLRAYHGDTLTVAPLTTVVDPVRYRAFARAWAAGLDDDAAYLYAHQLAEADVLALNKVDLVGADVPALVSDLTRRNPSALVIPYSARSGSVTALLDRWLAGGAEDRPDEELDYDRYAAAEAALAWLNQEVAVTGPLAPGRWARVALASLSRAAAGTLVGHAKVSVETEAGMAKGSVTSGGAAPTLDLPGPPTAANARAVFNLRVAWPPATLDAACAEAVRAADAACGTTSTTVGAPAAFQPSYPKPVHRLTRD